MDRLKRPERLLVAAMLVAMFAVNAVVHDEVSVSLTILFGVVFVVFVAGAFDPVAESAYLLLSLFVIQALLTGYAFSRGHFVFGSIIGLTAIDFGWRAGRDVWKSGQQGD